MVRKAGLILFLMAFFFFLSLLFWGKYELSLGAFKNAIGDKKENKERIDFILMSTYFSDSLLVETNSQVELTKKIKEVLVEANQFVIANYGFNKAQVTNLIYNSIIDERVVFSKESINRTFDEQDKKNNLLVNNLSWMFEKEFTSILEFETQLKGKIAEINNQVIIQRGFSDYQIKGLLLSVTKSATVGFVANNKTLLFFLTYILCAVGGLLFILPAVLLPQGIKNEGIYHHSGSNKGWLGIMVGTFLIGFYIVLYFYPEYIANWILIADPFSNLLSGNDASQWFMYGFIYTLAILVMGVRMIIKYRHNKYQVFRTCSVMFFQLAFAFLIPEILVRLNQPFYDFKNIWPLDYTFFFDWNLDHLKSSGGLGMFMLVWGIVLFTVGVPVFVYFFGKRWYCSWVCGCGGLAETLGDPYRQLSDKSLKAWKIERWLIHSVLIFVVVMTGLTLYTYFSGVYSVFGIQTGTVQKTYGFLIGSVFSGVVGTGFYPLMGNRVWCRFGCPLAAYLGLVQKFKSRFRITTNGGQCISCGNCSTYCEMGIDVRAYAQKGQNIVRSSCVGCGVCSAVCPRGVLKLENGPIKNRVNDNPIIIGNDGVLGLRD